VSGEKLSTYYINRTEYPSGLGPKIHLVV